MGDLDLAVGYQQICALVDLMFLQLLPSGQEECDGSGLVV
jgi:hypothetical protein